ncbi:hypothetical protein ACIBF5_11880 [Micromonospora sp. NPDC050417]|uniref:hypothetical protein n=1 Tax=Micromonospora sp. NPDC050417 TaxID=3364280 RepID=UPI003798D961
MPSRRTHAKVDGDATAAPPDPPRDRHSSKKVMVTTPCVYPFSDRHDHGRDKPRVALRDIYTAPTVAAAEARFEAFAAESGDWGQPATQAA